MKMSEEYENRILELEKQVQELSWLVRTQAQFTEALSDSLRRLWRICKDE
jgi:hypothetical protein